MSYTLPADVDERPVAIAGAGTLGQWIATVFSAGGTDVRIFDVSADQLDRIADSDAILASNSSSLATSRLIDNVTYSERVLNTHYQQPPQLAGIHRAGPPRCEERPRLLR